MVQQREGTGTREVSRTVPYRHPLSGLKESGYLLTGAADRRLSEALYLDDPDKNGVELYWDKPREQWPQKANGSPDMYTARLDLDDLLGELAQ